MVQQKLDEANCVFLHPSKQLLTELPDPVQSQSAAFRQNCLVRRARRDGCKSQPETWADCVRVPKKSRSPFVGLCQRATRVQRSHPQARHRRDSPLRHTAHENIPAAMGNRDVECTDYSVPVQVEGPAELAFKLESADRRTSSFLLVAWSRTRRRNRFSWHRHLHSAALALSLIHIYAADE